LSAENAAPLSDSATEPRANWTQLALGWLLYFCFGIVSTSLVPIITLVREDLGISYSEMGFVLGAWQLVYIGSSAPAGILIDRIGAKKALAIGALIMCASALIRSFADGFPLLFASVALFGLGGPVISSGIPKLVADWFTGPSRGLASGIYMTGAAAGGVFVLGLTHVLFLPMTGSWRGVLVFYSVIAAALAALWIAFGRDSPESISDRGSAGSGSRFAAYRQVILNPAVLVVVTVGFAGFLAGHGLRNWLPQILETGGMSPTASGLTGGALPALTGMLGSIVILRLASMRPGNRRPVTIGTLALSGVAIAATTFSGGWPLTAAIAVLGFCAGALMPLLLNTLMETPGVGARNLGQASGLFFAVGEVGGTLGPVLLGVTADATGSFTSGVLIVAAVMWVMILPALLIRA